MRCRKARYRRKWFAVPVVLSLLAGCRAGQIEQAPAPNRPTTPDIGKNEVVPITTLTAANNAFAMRLFAHLWQHDPNANVFVSPFSIAQALQMTLNGAGGDTRHEMEQTLGLAGIAQDDVNRQNNQLQSLLNAPDPSVTLAVANSLWTRDGALQPDFVRRVQTAYGAKLGSLNSGADAINSWVDEQTQHKISNIVTPLDVADTSAILVNAVYFKAKWADPFKKYETAPQPFTTATGQKKTVQMMRHASSYIYAKTHEFEAVTLPYAGEHYALTCVLPTNGTSLEATARALTPAVLTRAASGKYKSIELHLPRFRVQGDYHLKDVLTEMGMVKAFHDKEAEFMGMAPAGAYLRDALHKTFGDVDEEGTEAAASTAVTAMTMSERMTSEKLTFNRPFLVVLRETRSGLILFIGVVNDP